LWSLLWLWPWFVIPTEASRREAERRNLAVAVAVRRWFRIPKSAFRVRLLALSIHMARR
jgi:hypothetical protein